MLEDLPLDALERVVDRLRIAAEPFGHLLVGGALEIKAQRVRLERRETRAEAEDEALELLGGDHDERRLVYGGAGQRVAERAFALTLLSRGCVAERDVGVERRVLEAGRGLDRRDDLPCDAELRKAAERRLLVGPEVPDRLVEADQPFLQKVVVVAAREEVRARLETDESRVAADEGVHGDLVAVPCLEDELEIL